MNKKMLFASVAFLSFYQNFSLGFSLGGLWSKTETESIHREYAVHEQCVITVHNTEGSITIKSWPQNKLLIEGTKKGSGVEQKNTTISAKSSGTEASIITRVADNQKSSKVEYILMVPEDSTLRITQTNGPVKVRAVNGPIDISIMEKGPVDIVDSTNTISVSNHQGDIRVAQKKFSESGSIRLKSERGTISLSVPRETQALLYAKTGSGTIQSDHPVNLAITSKLNKETWEHMKKNVEGSFGNYKCRSSYHARNRQRYY